MVRVCVSLTHLGRVMHICVSNLTIIGSDDGLSPDRRQAIICTNAGILLIGPLGENFIGIQTFSLYKMHLKMSSAKWRPFYLGLNVLTKLGDFLTWVCLYLFYKWKQLSPFRKNPIRWFLKQNVLHIHHHVHSQSKVKTKWKLILWGHHV